MSVLFQLRRTGMRYNGTRVLDVDRLDFAAGEMVSVVGPNGAGKSTLLGVMAGLRERYSGQCLAGGEPLAAPPIRPLGLLRPPEPAARISLYRRAGSDDGPDAALRRVVRRAAGS